VKKLTPSTDLVALIRQRRSDLGLTQAQACADGGVEPSVWSKMERGQSPQLTITTALKMLKGVRYNVVVTVDDLPETPGESDGTLFSMK